jgi:hypothetical protein
MTAIGPRMVRLALSRPIFTEAIGQWHSVLLADEAEWIRRELAPYYALLGGRWLR